MSIRIQEQKCKVKYLNTLYTEGYLLAKRFSSLHTEEASSSLIIRTLLTAEVFKLTLFEDCNRFLEVLEGEFLISSLIRYLHDDFPLSKNSFFPDLEGKKFSQLDKGTQRKLLSTEWVVAIYDNRMTKEEKRDLLELMNKM